MSEEKSMCETCVEKHDCEHSKSNPEFCSGYRQSPINTFKKILDSGERRSFDSGAVRDIQEGKGRMDLLPLDEIGMFFNYLYMNVCRDLGDGMYYADKNIHMLSLIFDRIALFIQERNKDYILEAIKYFETSVYETPYDAIIELSKHYEEGAKKYDERNWEKGIPLHCYIDSGLRHLTKYLRGDNDEPHDRAFLWNMFGLLWTFNNKPELDDLPKYPN